MAYIYRLDGLKAEFYNLGKQITLCKVPAYMGIKEADKAANKQ